MALLRGRRTAEGRRGAGGIWEVFCCFDWRKQNKTILTVQKPPPSAPVLAVLILFLSKQGVSLFAICPSEGMQYAIDHQINHLNL